jgi:hypothetical protein
MKQPYLLPLIVLALMTFTEPASAQVTGIRLSEEARITLLTCSPGDELYSVFGHSAIRVNDPMQDLDWVFNYGTFDFSDPNFYINFVRGKLNYILSVADYNSFRYSYMMEERWIWEQELNINHDEKQYLFDSLIINYQPENRYYLYDFFFDNCATRIRDIFVEGIDRDIEFNYDVLETGKSFRELLMPFLQEKPWARLGINLALGLPSDKTATPWDYMFLPDHMMTVFEHAGLKSDDGVVEFAAPGEIILEGNELPRASLRHSPLWVFMIILMITIIISHLNLQSKRFMWWYDRILFGSVGLLGLLITFLWFGTDHQVTVWNLNILWAHPFHLIIIFFMSGEKFRKLQELYFMINLVLLVLTIFSWPVLPQALPWMIMPIVMALVVRSAVILRMFKPDIPGVSKKP